tara:strand:+ start:111 stop:1202 length:1092 start_codon:yes stop_codon:yes gene_type:complete
MKTLLLFGALTFGLNSFGQVPSYVPSGNLSVWYSFTGNTNDNSVNALNATNYNSTLVDDRNANASSAYSMTGVPTTYMEVPNPGGELLDAGTGDFSISLWFKTSGISQTFLHKRTMGGGGGLTNYQGYSMYVDLNGNAGFAIEDANFDNTGVASPNTYNDNNWHHMAAVRNISDDSVYLYVDGVMTKANEDLTAISTSSTTDLYIGKWTNYDAYSLNGSLDDIGIWKTALTACEIQDLYNAGLNSVVNTVSQTGPQLDADQTGAIYQWLDCDNGNQPINGETNQSYTSTVTGNYAVEVNMNGCIVTSSCYLVDYTGIEELNAEGQVLIKITDLMGRETKFKPNTPLLYIYSDGTIERKFELAK